MGYPGYKRDRDVLNGRRASTNVCVDHRLSRLASGSRHLPRSLGGETDIFYMKYTLWQSELLSTGASLEIRVDGTPASLDRYARIGLDRPTYMH